VIVVVALVSRVGRVVNQHPAGAVLDGFDEIDREVGVVCEAVSIVLHVLVAARIHDLSCCDLGHQASKGGRAGAFAIYLAKLVWVGDKLGLIEGFAMLVDGDVLQLGHVEALAEEVEFVAADGVLVLLVRIRQVRHVVELALVEPFDEELKAGGALLGELQRVGRLVAVALELRLEQLRVVA
jgi:hypothetical protein